MRFSIIVDALVTASLVANLAYSYAPYDNKAIPAILAFALTTGVVLVAAQLFTVTLTIPIARFSVEVKQD